LTDIKPAEPVRAHSRCDWKGKAMSILGIIVRTRAEHAGAVQQTLTALPGLDIAAAEGGRFVIVVEDCAGASAAATMAQITQHPQVLNTSLVYEYSGPDAPAAVETGGFQAWRRDLAGECRSPA
jgi:nitrate reductase NapAB chaperone NapD